MPNIFSLFVVTLVSFTCFVPAVSAAAARVGSAHMSDAPPATISDDVPVNPSNVMTEDFTPASSAAPSAGDVGIPAILPSSRPINRVGLIETNKAASISPEPKTSAGVFISTHRKLMTSAVEPNSPQSQGYDMSDDLSPAPTSPESPGNDMSAAAPGLARSSPKLILFMFSLQIVHYYYCNAMQWPGC
nr:hypothetical protein Iba_scaffold1421CG0470 [Ipomoea batatas]